MNSCKVTLELRSPVITAFQADTLFGALCWTYRYGYGEEKLKKFLSSYDDGYPIILLSDGFMKGFLPKPVLKPIYPQVSKELISKYYGTDRKRSIIGQMVLKRLRKNDRISKRVLDGLKEGLSEQILLEKALSLEICPKDFDYRRDICGPNLFQCPILNLERERGVCEEINFQKKEAILRSSISRKTGRVMEPGGLFSIEETFYKMKTQLEIYIKFQDISVDQIRGFFQHLESWGFGKDKSTGKGRLLFHSLNQEELTGSSTPNAFITLSSYVPRANDPQTGYYQTLVKYGKLDGHYSSGRIDPSIGHIPFKKPLVMFKAGSTFKISPGEEMRPFYGGLIRDIHWYPDIRHYGYAFPLGVHLYEDL